MTNQPTQRVALHAVLRDGHIDAYRRDHTRVPDELARLFREVGIHEWDIWRSGHDVFHIVVSDDFDAALARIAASPVNDKWMEHIGVHIDRFEGADGEGLTPLESLWSLKDQA